MNVNITTQQADNVLAVPVNALLALQGGGDGVEVVERVGQFPGVGLSRGQLTGDHPAENAPILRGPALGARTWRPRNWSSWALRAQTVRPGAQKPTSAPSVAASWDLLATPLLGSG